MSITKRVRSSGETTSPTCEYWSDPSDGLPSLISSRSDPREHWTKQLTGQDLSNFHSRVRSGQLIPQTLYSYFTSEGSGRGRINHTFDNGSYTNVMQSTGDSWCPNNSYWYMTLPSDLAYWRPEHDSIVPYVQDAAAKIYDSGHDTLTFIAELADVRRLFGSFLKKLLDVVKGVPPHKVGASWYQFFKGASSEWLSIRYGWRTLIYDVKEINDLLTNFDDKRTRYSERAGHTYSYSDSDSWVDEGSVYQWTHSLHTNVKVGVLGSVVADIVVPKLQFDIIQTGWEKLPFSFVVDWAFSVGSMLGALRFLSLQTDYAASFGYRLEVTRTYSKEITAVYNSYYTPEDDYKEEGASLSTLNERFPCSIPKLPRLRVNMNEWKALDLLALIIQHIRR